MRTWSAKETILLTFQFGNTALSSPTREREAWSLKRVEQYALSAHTNIWWQLNVLAIAWFRSHCQIYIWFCVDLFSHDTGFLWFLLNVCYGLVLFTFEFFSRCLRFCFTSKWFSFVFLPIFDLLITFLGF